MNAPPINERELKDTLAWLDTIPFSRPKRSFEKDFNDGLLYAQAINHFVPGTVKMEDLKGGSSTKDRVQNWQYLNRHVCKKMGYVIGKSDIQKIVTNNTQTIERVLKILKDKISSFIQRKKKERPKTAEVLTHPQLRALLVVKDNTLAQLRQTVEILQTKISKMDELIKLKDSKIEKLLKKIQISGLQ